MPIDIIERMMREDLPSARCLRQSSPKQKRRRVVGKQPPPEVWKEITFPMQITQGHCFIHALELASEFLLERKWCRELRKECCEVFDMRTCVVLWNNDACWLSYEGFLKELLGEVPDSLKLLEDQEVPMCPWEGLSCMYVGRPVELSVAGAYRVWLRKLLFYGDAKGFRPIKGYYQVGVPISLFRQLRTTGCFKKELLHCEIKGVLSDPFRDHLFQVKLLSVLNSIEIRKARYNQKNFPTMQLPRNEFLAAASLLRS